MQPLGDIKLRNNFTEKWLKHKKGVQEVCQLKLNTSVVYSESFLFSLSGSVGFFSV